MGYEVDAMSGRVVGSERDGRLINTFFVLYKNARIVESSNRAYKKQCRYFYEVLSPGLEEHGEVAIKAVEGRYFVNEAFVRFDDAGGAAATVLADWKTLGLGGVRFGPDVTVDDIEMFFSFMASLRPRAVELRELQQDLDRQVPATIELLAAWEPEEEVDDQTQRKQLRQAARTSFFRAVTVVQEVMSNSAAEREINLAKTRRIVHSLVDHIGRDQDSLLELAAIKDFDDYTYAHSINVSIYALTMGVRLGLERRRLSGLGFAALFHDIGKVKLSRDLIRKPDSFDENDWMQMQRHPLLGAKTILRNLKLDHYSARAARGAFEHHINADFTGYPHLEHERREPNLFSRIISIADTFDALTSGRVYFKRSIPPDKVLKKMHYQMGAKFDPFLLKVFNNIVGIYPAGTMVLLSTDEIGIVLTNNQRQFDRPYVKIVGDRNGLLPEAVWADLSLPEHSHRSIVRMIDPTRYGLNVRQFILDD